MTNVCAMTLLKYKTQILVIVFLHVVCAEMDSEETKGQAKKSFVSLLKNIVEVNEKRVLAMKKLENLHDFIVTKNFLSKIHGYDFGEEDMAEDMTEDTAEDLREQRSVLTLIDMRNNLNLTLRRTFKRQEATNNNINIIIPSNSYNIKSEFRNDENNRISNRNDFDSNMKHNKNDNDKINTINTNKKYKINNSNYKIEESNVEVNKIYNNSYKIEDTDKDEINYGYGDVKIHNTKDDKDDNDNSNANDDQKYTTNEDNNAKENRKGDDGDTIYRKNWRGASCDKRAAKVCRKACVDAHKNGCMLNKCSRRAKKANAFLALALFTKQ